ncbi:unnamed protein product [Peniophora sp. CBMAI 1063]|nr:unnamed protein product [Peniophora sp. CBMAI 1063]
MNVEQAGSACSPRQPPVQRQHRPSHPLNTLGAFERRPFRRVHFALATDLATWYNNIHANVHRTHAI